MNMTLSRGRAAGFDTPTEGLGVEEWDRLAGDHLYATSGWLDFCVDDPGGRTLTGNVHARLPGGTAAVPVTAVWEENNGFYQWSRLLSQAGLTAAAPQGLLVGPRRGYQTNLLISDGLDRTEGASVLLDELADLRRRAVADRLFDYDRADQLPCRAMFMNSTDVRALRAAGVRAEPVLCAADAWIRTEGEDWHGWMRTLPSKRRGELIRRDQRRFDSAGYHFSELPLSECYEEAARMSQGTQARYGQPADVAVLAESLRVQAEAMGDAARVLMCARKDGPPVGFLLFYRWGDATFLKGAGFHYDQLVDVAEYFNLVYYEPVRDALRHGRRWMHAGIASTDTKAMRGAEVRPLWMLDVFGDATDNDTIRAYNAAQLRELTESSTAVAKAVVEDEWLEFC
ncbi:peptidogalycan biosysnthesis protein [Streptomyces sp. A1499]|uniref:peptidogalycan biosysnthesis protein n=1 Tax=Streptomyces sp. A1499 TaxID=2563104 RepID=UPI00109ECB96|nr:peptidogalycan biosysnthesis protein [Streptomyces sp. A1499]THC44777.1 GNAT family N-acetyltransferase [Streptomyces sp. A1499]